jgi:hypothetical protein
VQTIDGDSWLRTDDYGVIDKLEHESVVTSFYRVILPIWPEHSAYVIRAADGSEQRIKIPLQKKSVLLGYLRFHSWMLALFFGAPAVLASERWAWFAPFALAFAALATVLTFFAGRLGESEILRRSLLRRVVGFGAPPELLTDVFRAEVRSNLELMWATKSETAWTDALASGECSELLVALAEYHQDPELLELAHANFSNKLWN